MEETIWADYISVLENYTPLASKNTTFDEVIAEKLEQLKTLVRQDEYRSTIPDPILLILSLIVQREQSNKILLPCLETLRNCYGKNWDSSPSTWTCILKGILKSIEKRLSAESLCEEDVPVIQISLQFVGNLLNSQPSVSESVWYNLQKCFQILLTNQDTKVSLYTSFVLYGILRSSESVRREFADPKWTSLFSSIIDSSPNEFLQYSIELYFKHHNLFAKLYNQQQLRSKLYLLKQIIEFLPSSDFDILNWQFMVRSFVDKSGVVLRTCESNAEDLEALEVVYLLEVLAKGSSEDPCRAELMKEDQLVTSAIDMLKSVHLLGKSGSNYFSTVKDYFAELEDHPAMNLKNNLVRLLGNLCYQNRVVQDRLRSEGVIASLLECSQLDARNKLIKEWSVWAIRNVCENNAENQELIRSYVRLGVTQPSILENSGLVVEDEGDSGLKLRPAGKEN